MSRGSNIVQWIKTRRPRQLVAVALVAGIVPTIAGCSSSSATGSGGSAGVDVKTHTIDIGGSAPLTGQFAVYKANVQGAEAYVDYVNAHGGINGWKIHYHVLDDQYQPATAVANARKLVTETKVFALSVFAGTPTALAALPYAISAKVPYVGLTAETGVLTGKYANATNVFGFVPPYAEVGAYEVNYLAKQAHFNHIGFVYEDDTVGQAHVAGAEYQAKKIHATLTTVPIPASATDFSGYCARLKAANVKAVQYVLGPPQAISLVKTCHSIGYNPQWMGAFYDPSPSLFTALGALGKNMWFESWLEPVTSKAAGMRTFVSAMGKYEHLEDPTILSQLGWVGMGIFLHGLQAVTANGKTPTTQAFEDALNRSATFEPGDLGAKVRYSSGNRLTHASDRVIKWTGRTLTTISGPTPDPRVPISLLH